MTSWQNFGDFHRTLCIDDGSVCRSSYIIHYGTGGILLCAHLMSDARVKEIYIYALSRFACCCFSIVTLSLCIVCVRFNLMRLWSRAQCDSLAHRFQCTVHFHLNRQIAANYDNMSSPAQTCIEIETTEASQNCVCVCVLGAGAREAD